MVYIDEIENFELVYDATIEDHVAMAFPEEGIQIETEGGFDFHWFTDGWSRFEGVRLLWSCDGKVQQNPRADPCDKVTDQSGSFFGITDVVALEGSRSYTTSDIIRNSLPMKGQDLQARDQLTTRPYSIGTSVKKSSHESLVSICVPLWLDAMQLTITMIARVCCCSTLPSLSIPNPVS